MKKLLLFLLTSSSLLLTTYTASSENPSKEHVVIEERGEGFYRRIESSDEFISSKRIHEVKTYTPGQSKKEMQKQLINRAKNKLVPEHPDATKAYEFIVVTEDDEHYLVRKEYTPNKSQVLNRFSSIKRVNNKPLRQSIYFGSQGERHASQTPPKATAPKASMLMHALKSIAVLTGVSLGGYCIFKLTSYSQRLR